MSKLFYDHLLNLDEVDSLIKETAASEEVKQDLWKQVEGIVNPKVLEKILDKLPVENHEEFLELFHKCPHDEFVIFGYLRRKTGQNDIEEILQEELKDIGPGILKEIKLHDEPSVETKLPKK